MALSAMYVCRRPPPPATAVWRGASCFVVYDACANLGRHRVVCGFSWLLRVIDHEDEAVLMDPFFSLVHRPVVLLKRRFGRQTSSRWRFSRNKETNDWVVQVIPQHAIKAKRVLSARKMVVRRRRQKLGWHFLLQGRCEESQPELGTNTVSLRAPNRPLSGSMAFLGHLWLNTVQKSKGKAKNPLNGARQ
jgi:hypothetical protein